MRTREPLLSILDLHATVEGNEILRGVDLEVPRGTVHALMGPNGSGKSTLANVLMGNPAYEVTRGRIRFKGQDVTEATPDQRARMGMFLAFQYPSEVTGVPVHDLLRTALDARGRKVSVRQLHTDLAGHMEQLQMDAELGRRGLNEGFSGGEKKRNEVLQMAMLEPELTILDEIDSGLDIDAIRLVAGAVNGQRGPQRSALVITHYMRILEFLKPDSVHVMHEGRVLLSGGPEVAEELERAGYADIRADAASEEVHP